MAGKKSYRPSEGGPWYELFGALAKNTSNLYGWGTNDVDDALEIRFKHQGNGQWLVVVKRYADDGGVEVLFASAFDFVSAFLAANAALAAGKWKVDTPWKPSG